MNLSLKISPNRPSQDIYAPINYYSTCHVDPTLLYDDIECDDDVIMDFPPSIMTSDPGYLGDAENGPLDLEHERSPDAISQRTDTSTLSSAEEGGFLATGSDVGGSDEVRVRCASALIWTNGFSFNTHALMAMFSPL